jgi:hypothetical protein
LAVEEVLWAGRDAVGSVEFGHAEVKSVQQSLWAVQWKLHCKHGTECRV